MQLKLYKKMACEKHRKQELQLWLIVQGKTQIHTSFFCKLNSLECWYRCYNMVPLRGVVLLFFYFFTIFQQTFSPLLGIIPTLCNLDYAAECCSSIRCIFKQQFLQIFPFLQAVFLLLNREVQLSNTKNNSLEAD